MRGPLPPPQQVSSDLGILSPEWQPIPAQVEMRQRKYTIAQAGDCQLQVTIVTQKLHTRKISALFFRGVIGRSNRPRLCRWNVHVFSRLGVAELLARFLLNGCLIALESLNLLCIALIF